MLENATRICEAKFGTLFRFDGEMFPRRSRNRYAAGICRIQKAARAVSSRHRAASSIGVIRTKQASHTADDDS